MSATDGLIAPLTDGQLRDKGVAPEEPKGPASPTSHYGSTIFTGLVSPIAGGSTRAGVTAAAPTEVLMTGLAMV